MLLKIKLVLSFKILIINGVEQNVESVANF